MTQNPLPIGIALISGGGAALAYGLGLGYLRRWRMRRFQRESGATTEQVETWFRPSHGWLSDLLRRCVALGAAYPMLSVGLLIVLSSTIPPKSPSFAFLSESPSFAFGIPYSFGFSIVLAVGAAATLHLICAERIAGGYILMALPRAGYDYAKAERRTRGWMRAGPVFSVSARVFGLILLGIAWFIGSAIFSDLAPHLQTWFGK